MSDGARIAIVVLCLGAVIFLLRVLVALVGEELIVRHTRSRRDIGSLKMPEQPRRERLVVIDAQTLQRRFGARAGSRRF